jgi:hypothetical protein
VPQIILKRKRNLKVNTKSDFINKLRELNIAEDDFVTLSYSEGAEVWHVNDDYIDWSAENTETCSMLGDLLASGVTISHHSGQGDILVEMRKAGLLDDYNRGDDCFAEYLTEILQRSIHDGMYTIEYDTVQYDYKRGRCDISMEASVRAGDIIAADANDSGRLENFSADQFIKGFNVSVKTPDGTLTLN